MADYKIPELGNKTPLEVAKKPNIDRLSAKSELSLVKTVPSSLPAGSDVANLSVLGYNPLQYYSGRSPLEAVSIGINLRENDITYRANLVTLSDDVDYTNKTMVDYSADEISTDEARELINSLKNVLDSSNRMLYSGISYRHCLVINEKDIDQDLTPPHDISGKRITTFLPNGELLSIMKKSYDILKDHKINKERVKRGLNPANSLWLWGEGTKPSLMDFTEKTGKKGGIISAVDLLKGIAISANMKVIEVEGATGNIHTNFKGKGEAAIRELKSNLDFIYLHVEAPDECSHRGELLNKIKSIELIDELIVGPVLDAFSEDEISILILPDHPTPLLLKTHTRDAVPYILYKNGITPSNLCYSEENAEKSGTVVENGYQLIDRLFS